MGGAGDARRRLQCASIEIMRASKISPYFKILIQCSPLATTVPVAIPKYGAQDDAYAEGQGDALTGHGLGPLYQDPRWPAVPSAHQERVRLIGVDPGQLAGADHGQIRA